MALITSDVIEKTENLYLIIFYSDLNLPGEKWVEYFWKTENKLEESSASVIQTW